MQIVTNDRYVQRMVKRGNVTHMISLALLMVGFVVSLPFATDTLGKEAIYFAYVPLIIALVLLNYGRTFTRRWGAKFRQDQWLIPGLRGLDGRHTLFNYAGPDLPDHVLVGPTGLYVLVPKPQSGRIRFNGRIWARGSVAGGIVRNLTEGGLGSPLAEVNKAMSQLAAYLKKFGSEELIQGLEGHPIIIFTNPNARLEIQGAPVQVIQLRELRAIFRRPKQTLPPEKIEELKVVLGREVES